MADKPFVLVQVDGGVAYKTTVGDVDTAVLDWDNIETETSSEILQELLDYADGIADTVAQVSEPEATIIRERVKDVREGALADLIQDENPDDDELNSRT